MYPFGGVDVSFIYSETYLVRHRHVKTPYVLYGVCPNPQRGHEKRAKFPQTGALSLFSSAKGLLFLSQRRVRTSPRNIRLSNLGGRERKKMKEMRPKSGKKLWNISNYEVTHFWFCGEDERKVRLGYSTEEI